MRQDGGDLVLDAVTSATVVSVGRRLDGMPLAIELAAARLRSMSLDELAGRLDQRFRLLTGGSRTALERQQTLRAAVSWSYYLAMAEAVAPRLTGREQGTWFDRLEADQANLRRAAEQAVGEPDGTSHVLRFGVALWRYWWARHRNEDAARLLVPVLRRPEAAADPALFAEALFGAAFVTVFTDLATSLRRVRASVPSGTGGGRASAPTR